MLFERAAAAALFLLEEADAAVRKMPEKTATLYDG